MSTTREYPEVEPQMQQLYERLVGMDPEVLQIVREVAQRHVWDDANGNRVIGEAVDLIEAGDDSISLDIEYVAGFVVLACQDSSLCPLFCAALFELMYAPETEAVAL